MDAHSSLLVFVEPRVGQVFGLVLVGGLLLAAAGFLLRPWPPSGRKRLGMAAALVLALLAFAALLRERRIEIDLDAREVRAATQILGLGPVQRWPFERIGRLAVEYPDFDLAIETPLGWRRLRDFDDMSSAETSALHLAAAGPWQVVRRGYRVQIKARTGDPQRFETARGQHGLMFDFSDAVIVVPAPGEQGPIEPQR